MSTETLIEVLQDDQAVQKAQAEAKQLTLEAGVESASTIQSLNESIRKELSRAESHSQNLPCAQSCLAH